MTLCRARVRVTCVHKHKRLTQQYPRPKPYPPAAYACLGLGEGGMADRAEEERKERAKAKFMAERAALLQKAQKRLAEAAEDSDEEEGEKWTTDSSGEARSAAHTPMIDFNHIG